MGIAIHYKGRLRRPEAPAGMITELKDIGETGDKQLYEKKFKRYTALPDMVCNARENFTRLAGKVPKRILKGY